jgi:hypothetical protein
LSPSLDTVALHDALVDCKRTLDLLLLPGAWKDVDTLEDELILQANAILNVQPSSEGTKRRAIAVGSSSGSAAAQSGANGDDNDVSSDDTNLPQLDTSTITESDAMDVSADGENATEQPAASAQPLTVTRPRSSRRRGTKRAITFDTVEEGKEETQNIAGDRVTTTRRRTKKAKQSGDV